MRPIELLRALRDRLDLVLRRLGKILFAEPLIDSNGRHHPALRSGSSARASAQLGDRLHTLRHLFEPSGAQPRRGSDVSGVAVAAQASGTLREKTRRAGRNAAA